MPHLTIKPADWTAEAWAEYQQCEAEAADIASQLQDRENAYEGGRITWDQYRNWEFDYGPLDGAEPDDYSTPGEISDQAPF